MLKVYRKKIEEAANANCQGNASMVCRAAKEAELATLMAEHLHQNFGTIVDLRYYRAFNNEEINQQTVGNPPKENPKQGASTWQILILVVGYRKRREVA
ncbi:hypothetical protein SO802_028432 [Lithocarpus litseifolius]|uniref:Uncharacterized protein n=1 Tax=Lithocarpus litseifolius TaxID=425828 RepID=A0AAW2BRA9_9ROSI